MTIERHRCCVFGCPNFAAFEVHLYSFDLDEPSFSFELDDSCPYLCVEHAIENERGASDDRRPWAPVGYPHTNREHAPGVAVYLQIEPEPAFAV